MSGKVRAVLIGGSAGAVDALSELLPALPPEYPFPVVTVLHVPDVRPSPLCEVLSRLTRLPVLEPDDKEPVLPGTVYVAPPGYHLMLEPGPRFAMSADPAVSYSRPSIDVLFESAADVLGPDVAAIVVSGANSDGASGIAAVCAAGGLVIVQDPDEAAMSVMPMAALQRCPSARVLTISAIARALLELDGVASVPR